MSGLWPWLWLSLLGAYHGINPGMGWLFAVALGLQERRRAAVWSALLPIALGHALSISAVVILWVLLAQQIPSWLLRVGAACVLLGFGLYRLLSSRHPRWGGMRVGWRDLTAWSFVMASAHGAGLMLLPVLQSWPAQQGQTAAVKSGTVSATGNDARDTPSQHSHDSGDASHAEHIGALQSAAKGGLAMGILAVAVHTIAYLLVTAVVAVIVYEWLGLGLLRKTWWNLDIVWAAVLIATGILTLIL